MCIRDRYITSDSLAYLSLEGLRRAVGAGPDDASRGYCEACFTGDYPLDMVPLSRLASRYPGAPGTNSGQ